MAVARACEAACTSPEQASAMLAAIAEAVAFLASTSVAELDVATDLTEPEGGQAEQGIMPGWFSSGCKHTALASGEVCHNQTSHHELNSGPCIAACIKH
jgi:hypothetical protein